MNDDTQTVTFNPDQLRAEAAVRRAAKAGNAEAQFRLGVMYGNGDGTMDTIRGLFNSGFGLGEAMEGIDVAAIPEVTLILDFIERSERGLTS